MLDADMPLGYLGRPCGNSIADLSDCEVPEQLRAFEERFPQSKPQLVHPPAPSKGTSTPVHQYRAHEVKGAPGSIMLPDTSDRQGGGFFLNSIRNFSKPFSNRQPSVTKTAGASLGDQLTGLRNKFVPQRSNPPELPSNEGRPNRFAYANLGEGEGMELQNLNSPATPNGQRKQTQRSKSSVQKPSPDFLVRPILIHGPDSQDTPQRDYRPCPQESSSPEPFLQTPPSARLRDRRDVSAHSVNTSLSQSPFLNLIDLREARARVTERRGSGQDDPTQALRAHGEAFRRALHNQSHTNSLNNMGSEPSLPSLPSPSRRGNRFASRGFAIDQTSTPTASQSRHQKTQGENRYYQIIILKKLDC